ncbi:reticulon-4-interacting protein 1 [Rhypophila decipiens]
MSSPVPPTMRAWRYASAAGGLEKNLTLDPTVPTPSITPGSTDELLIRVLATSLNPADHKVPEVLNSAIPVSMLRSMLIRLPATPCGDFCGQVVATSPKIDTFAVGDIVFGRLPPTTSLGAAGEYILAPTANCGVLPKDGPGSKISPEELASLPCAGLTAYQTLAPYVKEGDKVFINGGSGGCGTFGIQIAKALGCFVTTTCSTGKLELVKSLGADEVIDYTTVNVAEEMKKKGQVYTVAVDNVGVAAPGNEQGDLYHASGEFLIPGKGRFVSVGGPISLASFKTLGSRLLTPGFLGGGKSKIELYTFKGTKTEDYQVLVDMIASGKLKVVVEEVFGFEDLVEAFEQLKTGRSKGKLVVRVAKE